MRDYDKGRRDGLHEAFEGCLRELNSIVDDEDKDDAVYRFMKSYLEYQLHFEEWKQQYERNKRDSKNKSQKQQAVDGPTTPSIESSSN